MRNHVLTPLVSNSEIAINQVVNNIPQISEPTILAIVLPAKNGAITPAESQATAAFVKNSAKDLLWPTESLFIKTTITYLKKVRQVLKQGFYTPKAPKAIIYH